MGNVIQLNITERRTGNDRRGCCDSDSDSEKMYNLLHKFCQVSMINEQHRQIKEFEKLRGAIFDFVYPEMNGTH